MLLSYLTQPLFAQRPSEIPANLYLPVIPPIAPKKQGRDAAPPDPPCPTGKFESALIYASQGHARQMCKGTRIPYPYISHSLAVVALVMEVQGSGDEVMAALLHDLVEDAGGEARLADIRLCFGSKIADIVEGCNDTYGDGLGPQEVAEL
ncbi:MAG: HD domain-containing protein [Thermoleophilia bacterium]|jgi:(p)ppGpp synthase/HD superfamily hydrolase